MKILGVKVTISQLMPTCVAGQCSRWGRQGTTNCESHTPEIMRFHLLLFAIAFPFTFALVYFYLIRLPRNNKMWITYVCDNETRGYWFIKRDLKWHFHCSKKKHKHNHNQTERSKRIIPLLPTLPICLVLPRIWEGSGGRTEPWLNNYDDGYKRIFKFWNLLTKNTFSLSLGTWGSSNLNSWYPITVKSLFWNQWSKLRNLWFLLMMSHLKQRYSSFLG